MKAPAFIVSQELKLAMDENHQMWLILIELVKSGIYPAVEFVPHTLGLFGGHLAWLLENIIQPAYKRRSAFRQNDSPLTEAQSAYFLAHFQHHVDSEAQASRLRQKLWRQYRGKVAEDSFYRALRETLAPGQLHILVTGEALLQPPRLLMGHVASVDGSRRWCWTDLAAGRTAAGQVVKVPILVALAEVRRM